MRPSDLLYILGHGTFLREHFARKHYYTVNRKRVCDVFLIGADQIALGLHQSGLRRNHEYILVNACFGGGSTAVIPLADRSEGSAVLAQGLAVALGNLGYERVKVGGYAFLTKHDGAALVLQGFQNQRDTDHANLTEIEGTQLENAYKPRGILYEADPYRIFYDANGRTIRWNEPDVDEGWANTEIIGENDPRYAKWREHQAAVEEWETMLRDRGLG